MKERFEIPLFPVSTDDSPIEASFLAEIVGRIKTLFVNGRPFPLKEESKKVFGVGEKVSVTLGKSSDFAHPITADFCVESLVDNSEISTMFVGGRISAKADTKGSLIHHPGDLIWNVAPQVLGRIVKVNVRAEMLCGTCARTGQVGVIGHQVRCPVCKGDLDFVSKVVPQVVVVQFKIGMRSQMFTADAISIHAFAQAEITSDIFVPGVFISFEVQNRSKAPVRYSGELICESVEISGSPKASEPEAPLLS